MTDIAPTPESRAEEETDSSSPSESAPTSQPDPYTPAESSAVSPAPGKGLAITALILGIVALLGVAIPILNLFSAILAIVGLVLGVIALTRVTSKGLPLSGTIVSAVALLLSLAFIVVYIASLANVVNDIGNNSAVIEEAPTEQDAQPGSEDPAAPEIGTRENPAPLGTVIEVTEFGQAVYEVTLGASTLDATAAVLAENVFNEAPPEGFQYALIPVTVTYVGTESGTPWLDLSIDFVSAAGTSHTETDSFAVGPAPSFIDINELFPGGTGTGNIVILIPTENAAAGTWAVSATFGDPFFFAAQ